MTYWVAAADMLLVTGWSYGVSARRIAEAVSDLTGHPCTRNSVIGRADRCGLPRHALAVGRPTRSPPSPPAAPTTQLRAQA